MVVPFDPGGIRIMLITRRDSLSVALELAASPIHGKERVLHSTSRATHNFALKLRSSSRHGDVSTSLINITSISGGVSTGLINGTSVSGGVSSGLINKISTPLSPQFPPVHAALALRVPTKSCDNQFPLCCTSTQLKSLCPRPQSRKFKGFPVHHQGSFVPKALPLRLPARSCDNQFPLCHTSPHLKSLHPRPQSLEFRCSPAHRQWSFIPTSLTARSTLGSSFRRNVEPSDNQFSLCSISLQLESLHHRQQLHEFGGFPAHHQLKLIPNSLRARSTQGSPFCSNGRFASPHCRPLPQEYMLLTHISVPSGLQREPLFVWIQSIGQHVIDVPCLSKSGWSFCSHAGDVLLMLKNSCIDMIYLFIKCGTCRIPLCASVKQLCDAFSLGTSCEFYVIFQSLYGTVPAFKNLFTVVAISGKHATASTSFTANLLSNEDHSEGISRQICSCQSGKHTVYWREQDAIARLLHISTCRGLCRIERKMWFKKASITSKAVINWTPTIVLDQKSTQEHAVVNKKHCLVQGFPEQKPCEESLPKKRSYSIQKRNSRCGEPRSSRVCASKAHTRLTKHQNTSSILLNVECSKPELQIILPDVELATPSLHKQIRLLAFDGEKAFPGYSEPSSCSGMVTGMDKANQCNNLLIDQLNVEHSTKFSDDAQEQVICELQWKHSEHPRHLTMSSDRRNIEKFKRFAEVFLLQRRVAQLQRRAQLNPPFPPVTSMARCTMLATCHDGVPSWRTWSSPPTNQMSSVIVKEGAEAPAVMTWSSLPTIQMSSVASDKVQGGVNNWEKGGEVVIDMSALSRFFNNTVIDVDNLWPCSGQSGPLLSSKPRTTSLASLKSCTVSAFLFMIVAMVMYVRILLAGALDRTKRLQRLK